MYIHVELIKPTTQAVAFYDILNVDATAIARMRQCDGPSAISRLVSAIIKEKLPTNLYNYKVVDWTFRD